MNHPYYKTTLIKSLAVSLLLFLFSFKSNAQFSALHYIFDSEIKYPGLIFSGDFDMDGDQDAFVENQYPNGLYLFLNDGTGKFADAVQLLTTYNMSVGNRYKVEDMDNDGDGDVLENAVWYRNNGVGNLLTYMGGYSPATTFAFGLLVDLDGDGDKDDIGRTATDVVILLNNGSGVFTIGNTIGTTGTNTTIYIDYADVNGDLVNDIIVGGNNTQTGWYAGLGGGAFGTVNSINQFLSPATPKLGDMDGDGDVDLMAFDALPGMRWWSNDGTGVFTLRDTLNPDAARPEVVADLDGDGDLDYSLPTSTSCNFLINLNNSGTSWTQYYVEAFNGYNLSRTKYGVGDMDGDGDLDLLGCHGLGMAAWYPNLGNGQIGLRKQVAKVVSGGREITGADADLDGDVDFAVASSYGDFVTLYRSTGFGSFAQQELIAEHCDGVSKVRFADLDADGRPDLITDVASCTVIWNNGNNTWSVDTLPGMLSARQAMDADGDMDLDLICNGLWLQNDGNGNFTAVPDADIRVTNAIDTADINADGFTDIVVGNYDTLFVLLNNGAGDFSSITNFASAYKLHLADMDGDGDVDVASMNTGADVFIYLNDGNGNFTGGVQYAHPVGFSDYILTHDFDDDGDADVIWAMSDGYTHQIYMNRNIGGGTLGAAELIDPAAEVTVGMMMTDVNNDAVADLICTRFHSVVWRENLYFDAFRLRGCVFKDFDVDAVLDSTEQKVPFQLVRSSANNLLVWTNSAGDFDLAADTGTFDVWTVPPHIYQVTNNPDTLNATITLAQPIQEDLDFGIAPNAQDSSAFITLTESGFLFRCNSNTSVWAHVQNIGTFIPEHALLEVAVSPDVAVHLVTPAADSVAGNHYYWHIDSLGWFQQWNIYIEVTTGPLGTSSLITATVTWPEGAVANLFADSIGAPVSCSFDPNDKLVTPQGYGAAGAVDIDTDWLTYTVRFQNTGNDVAYNVVIRDTLDADLDWSSLWIAATSHPLTSITVNEAGLATFTFNQINLSDSLANEPQSHGFIKYRLAPVNGAPHGTQIQNTAYIYFDLNSPVATNTVLNTLVDCELYSTQISYNGSDSLTSTAAESYQWYYNGNIIPGATSQTLHIVSPGDYVVSTVSVFGCSSTDSMQVLTVGLEEHVNIGINVWPNPSNGDFMLAINETCEAVEIVDISGRVLQHHSGSKNVWHINSSGSLEPGIYIIRALKEGKQIGVTRIVVK